jgi:hypothetical protein
MKKGFSKALFYFSKKDTLLRKCPILFFLNQNEEKVVKIVYRI